MPNEVTRPLVHLCRRYVALLGKRYGYAILVVLLLPSLLCQTFLLLRSGILIYGGPAIID